MGGLVDYFNKGGPMMWPLLVLAIIGLAIVFERLITLYIRAGKKPSQIVDEVIDLFENQGMEEVLDYLRREPSPVAKVILHGLERVEKGRLVVEEAMAQKAASELAFLDRGMVYLTAIATLAPILGFLGTVTGMIRAFQAIAVAGEVEPSLVAGGISEALITTATGLIVAAPVAFFYAVFTSRINGFLRSMEEATNGLVEYLLERGVLTEGY